MFQKISAFVVTSSPVLAFAAPDTAAIDAVKADMLAYGGAMVALGIAVWGVLKIARLFGGR